MALKYQQMESSHLLLTQLLHMILKLLLHMIAVLAMDYQEALLLGLVLDLALVLESGMDALHLVKVEGTF